MKTLFNILAIASLFFIGSCDLFDDDPELPPITTEGKGTFGCLVDGKLFLNKGVSGFGNGLYAELQKSADVTRIVIYASNSAIKQNLIISIRDLPTLQVGKIYDLLSDPLFFLDYTDYSITPSCTYREVISGNVKLLKFEITNPQRMIIAGTFELTAKSVGCGETSITSGRFDISNVTQ